jgi:hypothetical protein
MKKASTRLVPLVIVLLVTSTAAQQTPSPNTFRFERPVNTAGAGPRRLAIDVPLLAGGRAFQGVPRPGDGLSDLRFFDAAGQEVPYLIVANPPADPDWRSPKILPVAPVETPTLKTSGFEADLGDVLTIDRAHIEGLAAPLLKRVRLEGSGDRERWTLLVGEGTVFDLPGEQLRQLELSFTPGAYRYVRWTWDDTRSGRVETPPVFRLRRAQTGAAPASLTAPLVFERRPSEPGRSQFRIRLPAARLPIVALDLDVGGGHILRDANVFEARLAGTEVAPFRIGGTTLKRAVRGDLTASALRVPISTPTEAQIDLVVEDGNNPPIDVRGVSAVFAELPWIYLETKGDGLLARYGNSSLRAPKYDLEAMRASLKIDAMMEASWGEARARAEAETPANLPPSLPTLGAELDASLFRYVRVLPAGDAGLVTVPLDAAALAHSRGGSFGDVRVLDSAARQVPYLIERASEPLSLTLSVERLSERPPALLANRPVSVYRVSLPFEGLPTPRIVLTTSARVFARQVSVAREREPDRRRRDPWVETLVTSNWSHTDQDTPALALALLVRESDARTLLVVVEEGDNSPLPIDSVRLLLPSYRLRLIREQGAALRLAYGRDDLAPPQYDLALLAPQLTGVAATEVVAAGEAPAASTTASSVLMSPTLFWGVLGGAALVLLALIVRLIGKSEIEPTPTA